VLLDKSDKSHKRCPISNGTNYLTSDTLGTPRVITNSDGSVKSRHDYLPFGEDIATAIGNRSSVTGYSTPDDIRQKFTRKERDSETGLDYFGARYYSSAQGRFTSPDEFNGGPDELFDFVNRASTNPTFYAELTNPQSLNKYQYAYNNPLRYVDPDGHDADELLQNPQQVPILVPVPAPVPLPMPVPIQQPVGNPLEAIDQSLENLKQTAPVHLIRQIIGADDVPKVGPNDAPPVALPQPGTPATQQAQPQTTTPPSIGTRLAPPPPMQAKGRKQNIRNEWNERAVREAGSNIEAQRRWLREQYKNTSGRDRLKIKAAEKAIGGRRSSGGER